MDARLQLYDGHWMCCGFSCLAGKLLTIFNFSCCAPAVLLRIASHPCSDVAAAKASGAAAAVVEDAEARLELLKQNGASTLGWADELEKGPLVDVVAWHDGAVWRAAVDTHGTGDLTAAAGLCDFKRERQWGVWDAETLLTYAVNVYEDGDVVSIVTDAGAHGTHVAGIVAAHHPHHQALDGVAPGAQIVSIKVRRPRCFALLS